MSNPEFSIPVEHVSDTAFLVAAYRITEGKKENPLFVDHLASKLVDGFNEKLAPLMPGWGFGEWLMTVRTATLDQMILSAVEKGVDTIVNLGAGLDTRPYRLNLPPSLKWIEIDLPGILQYKKLRLADESPRCQLDHIMADLSQDGVRDQILDKISSQADKVLILTEGLLYYLPQEAIINLNNKLKALPTVNYWLMDLLGPATFQLQGQNKYMNSEANKVKFQFLPQDGREFFKNLGWSINEFHSFLDQSNKLNRPFPVDKFPQFREEFLDGAGLLLLEKPQN